MELQHLFKTRIGLALGGGGARGIAHVGVLKAMSESDHKIDCIAGTSAGALVATLYAFGLDWNQIKKVYSTLTLSKIGMFSMGSGLMDGSRVATLVRDLIGDVDISEAKIPLAVVCCDLISGKNMVFTKGPAPLLVQASGAFPGLFKPVKYNGMLLVDGFLTENVPISAVKKLNANFIVSVDLGAEEFNSTDKVGIKDVLNRSFEILVDRPPIETVSRVGYSIDLDMSFMDRFKVSDVEKAVDLGYSKTKMMLSKSFFYWYFRPMRTYFVGISKAVNRLLFSILKRPTFRLPGFNRNVMQREN